MYITMLIEQALFQGSMLCMPSVDHATLLYAMVYLLQ